jgi:excisionase family DNA binding protein
LTEPAISVCRGLQSRRDGIMELSDSTTEVFRLDRLLNAREVAEILGCSRQQVYLLAERGQIASFKLGALRRFSLEDVRAWIEEHREPAAS